jgi:methyl-accepting chemotaxis protein
MRFPIKLKLALGFGVVILLAVGSGGLSLGKLASINDTIETIVGHDTREIVLAGELRAHLLLDVRAEKNLVLAKTDAEIDKFEAEMTKESNSVKKTLDDAISMVSHPDTKAILDKLPSTLSKRIEVQEQITKAARANQQAHSEEGAARVVALSTGPGRALVAELLTGAEQFLDLVNDRMNVSRTAVESDYQQTRTFLIAVLAVMVMIAVSVALWISIQISRGLGRAVGVARAVADGDLTQEIVVGSNDEIGDLTVALRRMFPAEVRNSRRAPSSFRKARPNRHPPPKRPLRPWKKWRRTSNRTPIMPARRKRSRANRRRMPRPAARRSRGP